MEFEDRDLETRRRIGLKARLDFEAAMNRDDESHTQRLGERLRERETYIYTAPSRTHDVM